ELLVRRLPADLAGDRELRAGGRHGAAADDRDGEIVGATEIVDGVRLVAERLSGDGALDGDGLVRVGVAVLHDLADGCGGEAPRGHEEKTAEPEGGPDRGLDPSAGPALLATHAEPSPRGGRGGRVSGPRESLERS